MDKYDKASCEEDPWTLVESLQKDDPKDDSKLFGITPILIISAENKENEENCQHTEEK